MIITMIIMMIITIIVIIMIMIKIIIIIVIYNNDNNNDNNNNSNNNNRNSSEILPHYLSVGIISESSPIPHSCGHATSRFFILSTVTCPEAVTETDGKSRGIYEGRHAKICQVEVVPFL